MNTPEQSRHPGPEMVSGQVHRFRDAMARLLSAVYVVTTWDEIGRPRGFTATSVIPLTSEPPRVVVAVDHTAASHDALTSGTKIGLGVLAGDQQRTASLFASKRPDKFEQTPWTDDHGVPLLEATAAGAACRVESVMAHGDHTMLVAVIESARVGGSEVLVVYDRAFEAMSVSTPLPSPRHKEST